MSDEVNQRLVTMIDSIGEVVKRADGFASEQLPLVVNEIIRWEIMEGLLFVGLALVFLSAGGWFARICWKEWKKNQEGHRSIDGGLWILCFILSCVSIFIGSVIIIPASLQTTKAITAPRLVVLNYVSRMR